MLIQPAPASAGEETEEDQQFRTIFQQIAGNVSTREPENTGVGGDDSEYGAGVGTNWLRK